VLVDVQAAKALYDLSRPLDTGDGGVLAYANAVATYLAFAVDKAADYGSTVSSWNPTNENVGHLFAKQSIPMIWTFAEANLLKGGLSFDRIVSGIATYYDKFINKACASSEQLDARATIIGVNNPLISTDPPYYDNIGYSDISDFFYVWLRRSLDKVYPNIFSTMLVPKVQELVATPYRFNGDKQRATQFFEEGLGLAFIRIREAQNREYPLTVYYAFKQSESENDDDMSDSTAIASTGWETMLEGLLKAKFIITGTWPMRSERGARSAAQGTNALASSIVLVCRPRSAEAPLATRRELISALKSELPKALSDLQRGSIAPADLAQATIGPGMSVFSGYAKVMESDGSPMSVRTALGLINQTLDEVLAEQEGEFDADTRWALAWFEQHGMEEGPFGVAETLSKAKNTAINGLVEDGIVTAHGGKVKLISRNDMPEDWDPTNDKRLTIWEATQHLIRTLDKKGEQGAADLLRKLGGLGETARDLSYRLYSICERKKWAQEALAYNSLVIAWPEITKLAQAALGQQTTMFDKR